jgi:hypothetical protein
MQGLVRPSRRSLGDELYEKWRTHLCGLCLCLRDEAGYAARLLTSYDAVLLSVLAEAQGEPLSTRQAGPCPLRGFMPAQVVEASQPAIQLAATGALLAGAVALRDKVRDREVPRGTTLLIGRAATAWERAAGELGAGQGFDTAPILRTAAATAEVEGGAGPAVDGGDAIASLGPLLAPAGRVGELLFAGAAAPGATAEHKAAMAGAGQAYGRLVHLVDAVQDRDADRRAGKFNALEATGTSDEQARAVAAQLHQDILRYLARAQLTDRRLVDALFGAELSRTLRRVFRSQLCAGCSDQVTCADGALGPVAVGGAAVALVSNTYSRRPPRRRRRPRSKLGHCFRSCCDRDCCCDCCDCCDGCSGCDGCDCCDCNC